MIKDADYWIKELELMPHPEGGYYKEIYRSMEEAEQSALPSRYGASRLFYTSIYFLLVNEQVSHFHRIKSDEIWAFHCGNPLDIHVIDESGNYSVLKLGLNSENGEKPQQLVKNSSWFGSNIVDSKGYALVSCIVAPGFHFDDFEMGKRNELIKKYPEHRSIIEKLTIS